jgi:hypothetical protein
MKNRWLSYVSIFILFLVLGVGGASADYGDANGQPLAPMGQGFTYQGQLNDSGGHPINKSCDFRFIIYDAEIGGGQVGPIQEKTAISVNGGHFTVLLDFGSTAFLGDARWLEVAVKCSGDDDYSTLSPRQPLTPTPYALDTDLLDGQHAMAFSSAGHTHWGQTWTGSSTGLTLSSDTIGLSSSGSTYGVYGLSTSTSGSGVYGNANATSGTNYGVYGISASTTGTGVYGNANAISGTNYGVYGISASTDGTGVYGNANAISGTSNGVYGISASTAGTGVYGNADAISGTNYGVYGVSASTDGTGVYGNVNAINGNNFGVYGQSSSTDGTGVYGNANATSGFNYGVYGQSSSIDGTGVYGIANATSGYNYGVYGVSHSTTGAGVYGFTDASSGTVYGVRGYTNSTDGFGMYGHADMGGSYTTAGVLGRGDADDGYGVAGQNYWNGVGVGAWSYTGNLIEASSGDYPGGTLRFYINPLGDVYADGTYNTFTPSSLDGETHATSSIQSTEVWLEDFGRGDLADGIAVITIAPDFAGITNLSVDYMVFVTLEGNCQGVYITNKTPSTFEVHELNGGTSDVPFGYRIVAKQAGAETARLPEVTIPATVEVPRQLEGTTLPPTPPQPQQAPAPIEQGQFPAQVQP